MTTQDEMQATLTKLVEATAEGKETTRELHAARRSLFEADKASRDRVTAVIVDAVEEQVKLIAAEVRSEMRAAAVEMIRKLEADWRAKLGLDHG